MAATADWASFGGTGIKKPPIEREQTLAAMAAPHPEEWSEPPRPSIVTTMTVGVNTTITAVREEVELAVTSSMGRNNATFPQGGGGKDLDVRVGGDKAGLENRDPPLQEQRPSRPRSKYGYGGKIDLAPGDRSEFSEELLSRVLTTGFEFGLLGEPQATWNTAMRMVAAALARAGYDTPLTVENKKQRKDGDRNWHYGSLMCTCSGKPRHRPRHDNPEKRRKTRSAKCGCTFGVSIAWPRTKKPYVTQVNLAHSAECSAEIKLKRRRVRHSREARKTWRESLSVSDQRRSERGSEDDGEECLVDVGDG